MTESCQKIIHIVSSLQIGGAERFVIDLCKLQNGLSYQAMILSFGINNDPLISQVENAKVDYMVAPKNKLLRYAKLTQWLRSTDIIHIHSTHALKAIAPLLPLLKQKVVIYTRHGAANLSASHWLKLHKKVYPFIKAVTFVSTEAKQIFQEVHHWQGIPSPVIDNGINLADVVVQSRESNKLNIGSVGRMVALKGQIDLLSAVNLLPVEQKQQIALHFFGDGECRQQLESYVNEQLNDVEVVFHGIVKDRDIIYNTIDVLAVTSETEGLSLAIIEAMAYRKAILATEVGGNPKLVINNENGWLFDYQDINKLSDYMLELLKQPKLLEQFGEASYQKVAKRFSLSAAEQHYTSLYKA